jgi:cytidine deaminase
MEELTLKSRIRVYQRAELDDADLQLIDAAIASTAHSYAPHSHFHVGAAIRLANGVILPGCNQENAAFPSGICAERSAIFAAGAQYPDQAVTAIAITARDANGELLKEPVSPCGTCRQVLIETEHRFRQEIRILLYGSEKVYVMQGIKTLMPLSFTEF